MSEHLPLLVLLTFFGGALCMPLAGLLHRRAPWAVAVASSALAAVFAVYGLLHVAEHGVVRYAVGGWIPPIGIELVADPLSSFMLVVLAIIALVTLAHSRDPVEREVEGSPTVYYAAALLMLGGFAGIVSTGDLFNLYVFLEIAALASYALLGAKGPRSAVAAFRYLILGTIGASFYLIGVGFIFITTGTLNIADVAANLGELGLSVPISVGAIFMVVGTAIKFALVPFHQWLPDAYTAAPSSSAALVAPIGTKVAAYVLVRLLLDVFPGDWVERELYLLEVLGILGAAGILWGSIMAIPQQNLKRMLAYSSVAQIGYIALGIGLGTAYGFIGAILHILNHACMKGCLFLVSSNLETRGRGVRIDAFNASLRKDLPISSAAFALAAISMIGLPPTAGFFSKWYLLLGSYEEGRWFFIVTIVVSSLLNAVYFFRILERMYLGGKDEPARFKREPGTVLLTAPVLLLALGLLLLGFGNAYLVSEFISPILRGH
jgi:multicomponent Na+:H+ antiporter subunit D